MLKKSPQVYLKYILFFFINTDMSFDTNTRFSMKYNYIKLKKKTNILISEVIDA